MLWLHDVKSFEKLQWKHSLAVIQTTTVSSEMFPMASVSLQKHESLCEADIVRVCMCVCSWAPSAPTLVDAEIPVLITPAALLLSWLAGWVASEAHVSPSLPHTRPFCNVCVCVCVCVCAWRAGRRLNAAASVLAFGRKNAFNSCSLATVAQPRC